MPNTIHKYCNPIIIKSKKPKNFKKVKMEKLPPFD